MQVFAAEAIALGPNYARILASSLPESLTDLKLAENVVLGRALVAAVKMDEAKGRHVYWKMEKYQDKLSLVQGRPFKNHAACPTTTAEEDGPGFAGAKASTKLAEDDEQTTAKEKAAIARSAAVPQRSTGWAEIKEGDVLQLVKPPSELMEHKLKWMRILHKGLLHSTADSGEACVLEVLDAPLEHAAADVDPLTVSIRVG